MMRRGLTISRLVTVLYTSHVSVRNPSFRNTRPSMYVSCMTCGAKASKKCRHYSPVHTPRIVKVTVLARFEARTVPPVGPFFHVSTSDIEAQIFRLSSARAHSTQRMTSEQPYKPSQSQCAAPHRRSYQKLDYHAVYRTLESSGLLILFCRQSLQTLGWFQSSV